MKKSQLKVSFPTSCVGLHTLFLARFFEVCMPNFYLEASDILQKIIDKKATIKTAAMSQKKLNKKQLYAILCQSLKFKKVILEVIQNSELLKHEKKMPTSLAILLVHDLLFGKGIISSPYKQKINKHRTRLLAELTKIKIRMKVKNNEELIPAHIRDAIVLPRYIRVNTLKTSVESVINHFESKGYIASPGLDENKKLVIAKDPHIRNLLILPPNTDLHDSKMLLNGSIIIQDKASCFPAFILNPPKNSIVIDACAAPGNKTSHLSAIMENSGRIYAFDKDKRRLDTLIKLTRRAGCTNIEPLHISFLDCDPSMYSNVEYVLLDPSCSGSGIVGRMDHLIEDEEEEQDEEFGNGAERLDLLANFQKEALLHALSFPNVKKVVYSTCSKHKKENEDVVRHALSVNSNFRLSANVLPNWKRRGLEGEGYKSTCLIRTLPSEDLTIGFFVALFERISF